MNAIRNVAVMMSFGSGDQRRRNTLQYLRLKYLIEHKVSVTEKNSGTTIEYHVDAYNFAVGSIPEQVIPEIARTDVLVGFITEKNVNVIYELAVRNVLRDEMLLIVKPDDKDVSPEDLLPDYLTSYAFANYDQLAQSLRRVDAIIENMVAAGRDYRFNDDGPPAELSKAIDDFDLPYAKELESSLSRLEWNPPRRPDYLLNLGRHIDPTIMLSGWTTYYPYSVLEVTWRGKSSEDEYAETDMIGQPTVYSANDDFFRLYNIASADHEHGKWTGPRLLQRLSKLVDNLPAFADEHKRVAKNVVFADGFDWVRVPLKFNEAHPNGDFRNKWYLPVIVGKFPASVDVRRPHSVYHFVVYVDVTPLDDEKPHDLEVEE